MFRVLLLSSLITVLAGCADSSTVITGAVSAEVERSEVEVFYTTAPNCEFEVIAYIDIPGNYFSRASLIRGFRNRAAAIGASAVQITYMQQLGVSEYMGSGRALRCQQG